jgi:quinol-cytochrome oxidoreductase complex cytochrome b subunit
VAGGPITRFFLVFIAETINLKAVLFLSSYLILSQKIQMKESLFSRIIKSIFRSPVLPQTDAEKGRFIGVNFLFHLRPRKLPERALEFKRTFGLGGIALVLLMLLLVSGILLKFVYVPFPGTAYDSILQLQEGILFGQLIRNIHHWSANALVVAAFLHLLRVLFTGGFHAPRQFNWVIGLVLLFAVMVANFTGYLLPWDQLAYWAITICMKALDYLPLLGGLIQQAVIDGSEIGTRTLLVFFTLHTTVIPALMLILLMFHFWRVRKAKGIVLPPTQGTEAYVSSIPQLFVREAVVALVVVAAVLLFSMLVDAPLAAKANPGLSPNPAKAPWYFMGFQELLIHFHPVFAVFVIPLLAVLGLLSLPYKNYAAVQQTVGVWFVSPKGRTMAVLSALVAIVVAAGGVVAHAYHPGFSALFSGLPPLVSAGVLPLILIIVGIVVFQRLLQKRFAANSSESVQALMVFFITVFIVLTLVGIFFRQEGMVLGL